jgi:hypothetical protein
VPSKFYYTDHIKGCEMGGSCSTHNGGKLCRNIFLPQTARKNSFDDGRSLEDTRNEFKGTGCEVVSLVRLAGGCSGLL